MTLLKAIFWFAYAIPALICLAGAAGYIIEAIRAARTHRDGDCRVHLWNEKGGYDDRVCPGLFVDTLIAAFVPYYNLVGVQIYLKHWMNGLGSWAQRRFPRPLVADTAEHTELRQQKFVQLKTELEGAQTSDEIAAVFGESGCVSHAGAGLASRPPDKALH